MLTILTLVPVSLVCVIDRQVVSAERERAGTDPRGLAEGTRERVRGATCGPFPWKLPTRPNGGVSQPSDVSPQQVFESQAKERINFLRNMVWTHLNQLSQQCVTSDEVKRCWPAQHDLLFTSVAELLTCTIFCSCTRRSGSRWSCVTSRKTSSTLWTSDRLVTNRQVGKSVVLLCSGASSLTAWSSANVRIKLFSVIFALLSTSRWSVTVLVLVSWRRLASQPKGFFTWDDLDDPHSLLHPFNLLSQLQSCMRTSTVAKGLLPPQLHPPEQLHKSQGNNTTGTDLNTFCVSFHFTFLAHFFPWLPLFSKLFQEGGCPQSAQ